LYAITSKTSLETNLRSSTTSFVLERRYSYHKAFRVVVKVLALKPCLPYRPEIMVLPPFDYRCTVIVAVICQLKSLRFDVVYRAIDFLV
jgi:hypothetical protein